MVISLKKYLELDPSQLRKQTGPGEDDLLSAILDSYRAALLKMAESGAQACPPMGADLQRGLLRIVERLSKDISVPALKENDEQIVRQLQQWGERSSEYLKQKANEIKDVLIVLTRSAELMSQRDQRYTTQFSTFTTRLQNMANLDDLPKIRASLMQSARELKSCVDQMSQDGRESAALLKAEAAMYQTRWEEAEQRASRDSLTGVYNRSWIESAIERRIALQQPFCVAMFDLNGFKQVNDCHGHLTGDDLLKQFAAEMRSLVRSSDIVARWGGDEFLVLLDCTLFQAGAYIERQKKWLFGEYTINSGHEELKVHLTAAIGLTEWQLGESLTDLLARVDSAMYETKVAARRAAMP